MRGRLGAPSTSRVCAVGCPRPGCDLVVPWARRAKYNYSGIARPICVTPGHRVTRKNKKKQEKNKNRPGFLDARLRPAPSGGTAYSLCVVPRRRAARINKNKIRMRRESKGLCGFYRSARFLFRGHGAPELCRVQAPCYLSKQRNQDTVHEPSPRWPYDFR